MENDYLCPLPNTWAYVYIILKQEAKSNSTSANQIPPPPKPISGAQWIKTSDKKKGARWQEMIQWAEQYDLLGCIPEMDFDEKYQEGDDAAFEEYIKSRKVIDKSLFNEVSIEYGISIGVLNDQIQHILTDKINSESESTPIGWGFSITKNTGDSIEIEINYRSIGNLGFFVLFKKGQSETLFTQRGPKYPEKDEILDYIFRELIILPEGRINPVYLLVDQYAFTQLDEEFRKQFPKYDHSSDDIDEYLVMLGKANAEFISIANEFYSDRVAEFSRLVSHVVDRIQSLNKEDDILIINDSEPWLLVRDSSWDRKALKLWHEGKSLIVIANAVGREPETIQNRLGILRKEYGEKIVPLRRIPKKYNNM
jgi:hypothetical protein